MLKGKAKADVRGRRLNVAWFLRRILGGKTSSLSREPDRRIGVYKQCTPVGEPVHTGRRTGAHRKENRCVTVYLIFSSGGPSLQYTGGHTGRWLETPIFAPEVEPCGSLPASS